MLMGNKVRKKVPMKITIFVGVIAFILMFAVGFNYLAQSRLDAAAESVDSGGEQGATTSKDTEFNGTDINTNDPDALQAYCDDMVEAAKREGGAVVIRDMCLLNSITKEHIPLMTNEQITEMANNRPSCLETGYDDDGYNCFTGFNRDGCGRDGIDESGKECHVDLKKQDPMQIIAGIAPENFCSMVSSCQSETAFNADGFNEFGCNRQGRLENGTLCPAEYITRLYGDDGRDQLGFTPEGFNEFHCDAQGVRVDGTLCPLDEVTRVYNRKNLDQWGFTPEGFNEKGCSLEGLRADGTVCPLEDITHVYDPTTGLDQFNLGKDGFNVKGCSLAGFNRSGERCALEDIPSIVGKNGLNQLGFRSNGRNVFNCDIHGRKPNGEICKSDEITRVIDPMTGQDQFSFFENGRNEHDCDFNGLKPDGKLCSSSEVTRIIDPNTGLDANNLDEDGFNLKGCNTSGVNRLGNVCALEDIPRIFKKNGLDQFNLDSDGFNEKDCNLQGLNRKGEVCPLEDIPKIYSSTGFNQLKLDDEGFSELGCNLQGLNREGELCPVADIPRIYSASGVDQLNLNSAGYSIDTQCNLLGFKPDGSKCSYENIPKLYDAKNLNQLGLDSDDRNEFGCNLSGFMPDGARCIDSERVESFDDQNFNVKNKDKKGYGRLEINDLGFNKHNCDLNGLTPEGKLCPIENITRVFNPLTNLDQFGLDEDGYNEKNCNLEGFDRNANACAPEDIPRIFDKDMKDQFGVDINDLPSEVWEAQASKLNGLSAMVDSKGNQLTYNGEDVFIDKEGNLRRKDGSIIAGPDGSALKLNDDNEIISSAGLKIPKSAFRTKSGDFPEGSLGKVSTSFSPLTDSTGNHLQIDGQDAYVDEDGFIRLADGSFARGENGEKLKLNKDNEIVNTKGEMVTLKGLLRSDGKEPIGNLHKDSGAEGLKALLDDSGRIAHLNGKPVFVDKDGNLRYADNSLVTDADGNPLEINGKGQIVTKDGQVIPASMFSTAEGKKLSGKLTPDDKVLSKSEIEAKLLAEKLNETQRQALGLDDDGFNEFGCGLNALNRQGLLCDPSKVPRVYDEKTKLDQLGFGPDGYNPYGCDFYGKDRSDEYCDRKFVTEIKDKDNFNQFDVNPSGFKRSGLNAKGANAAGCDAKGKGINCSALMTPKLKDSAGVDQFHKRDDKSDRLGLINGFNELDCNLQGVNKRGEICKSENIPRFYNNKGDDQFGVKVDGVNRFGCQLNGLKLDGSVCKLSETPRYFDKNNFDQFGLTPEGFNEAGCSLAGFKSDGTRCAFEDIPKIYSDSGLDQLGFRPDGYNVNNCDINGLNREGAMCALSDMTRIYDPETGLDQLGLTEDGYNIHGCNLEGVNREGALCSPENTTRLYDAKTKLDQFGFQEDGFNLKNCNFRGFNREGNVCNPEDITRIFNKDNVDQFGTDKATGLNENGCGLNGRDKFGKACKPSLQVKFKSKQGKDQFGFIGKYNENGCDINGLDKDGARCSFDDVTRIINEDTKEDQFGFGENKFNENGCDVNGLKIDGSACSLEQVTSIFDIADIDQFGLNKERVNKSGCNILGFRADGSKCDRVDTPIIFGNDGKDYNGFNLEGFADNGKNAEGYYSDGCDDRNRKADGTFCDKYESLDYSVKDEEYVNSRAESIKSWMDTVKVKPNPIVAPAKTDFQLAAVTPTSVTTTTTTVPVSVKEALLNGNNINNVNDFGNKPKISGGANGIVEIPVGYMTQIFVKTPVNSDYTQDVYAEISLGELETATLKGKIVVPYIDSAVMPRDKFYYEWNQMIYNRVSYSIDAVSINTTNDSGMVTSDDVDYHRVQRYGGLILAAAVQALDASFLDNQAESDAKEQAAITEEAILASSVIYGENTRELTKQNLQVATSYVSDLAKEQFYRRPTITKGVGPQIIIFRSELEDDSVPAVFTGIE